MLFLTIHKYSHVFPWKAYDFDSYYDTYSSGMLCTHAPLDCFSIAIGIELSRNFIWRIVVFRELDVFHYSGMKSISLIWYKFNRDFDTMKKRFVYFHCMKSRVFTYFYV